VTEKRRSGGEEVVRSGLPEAAGGSQGAAEAKGEWCVVGSAASTPRRHRASLAGDHTSLAPRHSPPGSAFSSR
jgi:hypothetical protein